MFLTLKADKDTYITNKFVNGKRVVSGNVGVAGSLDLFKLYGMTRVANEPQLELSRLLIHFDLDPLRSAISSGKIDVSDQSFKCFLSLKDAYGGQSTPSNFSINVFPLSASFDEGVGKDSSYYVDEDKANFLSSSKLSAWFEEGAALACFSTSPGDYITSSVELPDTKAFQTFKTGEENMLVDVTSIVSATISGDLPDSGFRISYGEFEESNLNSYFVKRFVSRHAYDESKHPKLIVKFDDSISDDNSNLFLDSNANLFLYNYSNGALKNLVSSSFEVSGSDCILLELQTQISGTGVYSLFFTGSQHSFGSNYSSGIYYAPVLLPLSDSNLAVKHRQSGNINFTPIWTSLDRALTYVTGSTITAYSPQRTSRRLDTRRYTITALGINSEYSQDKEVTIRVQIFDENSPIIIAKRLPIDLPGAVLRNTYYGIRDISTNEYAIPFDTETNSTRLSSDAAGMYFSFNTSALTPLRAYVIDIMTTVENSQQKYLSVGPAFKINTL